MRLKNYLFYLVFILLYSCGGLKSGTQKTIAEAEIVNINDLTLLQNTDWKIIKIDTITVRKSENGTFFFGKIENLTIPYSGVSFVNNYSGSFDFNDMGNFVPNKRGATGIMTLMTSTDERLNFLEMIFQNNLGRVVSFQQINKKLTLITGEGKRIELIKK
jgi:hypothetical protein